MTDILKLPDDITHLSLVQVVALNVACDLLEKHSNKRFEAWGAEVSVEAEKIVKSLTPEEIEALLLLVQDTNERVMEAIQHST